MSRTPTPTWRKGVAAGALLLTGLAVGGMVAGSATANAATGAVTSTASSAVHKVVDESRSVRSDEHLLTGATADKVKAAALAKYPGATVQRVESDSDGVYEAHVVTKAGDRTIVQVGKDFTVTGTQQGGSGGAGGPGGAAPGSTTSG